MKAPEIPGKIIAIDAITPQKNIYSKFSEPSLGLNKLIMIAKNKPIENANRFHSLINFFIKKVLLSINPKKNDHIKILLII